MTIAEALKQLKSLSNEKTRAQNTKPGWFKNFSDVSGRMERCLETLDQWVKTSPQLGITAAADAERTVEETRLAMGESRDSLAIEPSCMMVHRRNLSPVLDAIYVD